MQQLTDYLQTTQGKIVAAVAGLGVLGFVGVLACLVGFALLQFLNGEQPGPVVANDANPTPGLQATGLSAQATATPTVTPTPSATPTSTETPPPTATATRVIIATPPPPTEASVSEILEEADGPFTAAQETLTPDTGQLPPEEPPPSDPLDPDSPATPLEIVDLNRAADYVDLRNVSEELVNLAGWRLEAAGNEQTCPLQGVLQAGQTLRVWATSEDLSQGGFNCGFESNFWADPEADGAVLFNPGGVEVSRLES